MLRLQAKFPTVLRRLRRGVRPYSTTLSRLKDTDSLSAIFEEMENCDIAAHSPGASLSPSKIEGTKSSSSVKPVPSPVSNSRVRLEEAKQKRLQSQLRDVGEELNALLAERRRTAAVESNKAYVPARAARTYLSSAELVVDKSPQEFIADEKSVEEVEKLPSLQHSGCAAVVTMVGVVTEAPHNVKAVFPGGSAETDCTAFAVRYEIPFVSASASMHVAVRAVGATLSTFALECVGVGDVVHVLGHLAPGGTTGKESQCCVLYVLPAGGNISVVLSKASA